MFDSCYDSQSCGDEFGGAAITRSSKYRITCIADLTYRRPSSLVTRSSEILCIARLRISRSETKADITSSGGRKRVLSTRSSPTYETLGFRPHAAIIRFPAACTSRHASIIAAVAESAARASNRCSSDSFVLLRTSAADGGGVVVVVVLVDENSRFSEAKIAKSSAANPASSEKPAPSARFNRLISRVRGPSSSFVRGSRKSVSTRTIAPGQAILGRTTCKKLQRSVQLSPGPDIATIRTPKTAPARKPVENRESWSTRKLPICRAEGLELVIAVSCSCRLTRRSISQRECGYVADELVILVKDRLHFH